MKKIGLLFIMSLLISHINAQDIQLPAPEKTGGMSLMEALSLRKTERAFSEQELTEQQLSNLLWAAAGVNRADGKLTAPTARNAQQMDIYVYTTKAVYLYDAKKNSLKQIVQGDYRKESAMQPFAQESPLILVYVANYDKMEGFDDDARALYGATDCGNIAQNVYLFCAANGLNTVELGSIYRNKIKDLLKFNGKAILGQPVGFPKGSR